MKKTIADLLLIAGVITASIAAAESRRVSRTVELTGDLSQEVLHHAVSSHALDAQPDNYVLEDRTLEPGTALTPEVVTWLKTNGHDSVSVLRQPQSSEELPVGNEALGRVLQDAVVLNAEPEDVPRGRILDKAFVERLEAAGHASVRVSYQPPSEEGERAPERRDVDWNLLDASGNPEGVELVGCRLAEQVTVPIRLKASTYLDQVTLERLANSGYENVNVRIPGHFAWRDWGLRWTFVAGALLTLFGVLLKRSRASGAEVEASAASVASLAAELVALEASVEQLLERAELLDAAALHEAVDPLLTGPVYRFAEGREAIRTAHGSATYMAVMDAFARAERKLNRTWSAAVDGYAAEARSSLQAVEAPLREAREALPGTRAAAGRPSAEGAGDLCTPPDVPGGPGADDPRGQL